jgi:hypothetical protein
MDRPVHHVVEREGEAKREGEREGEDGHGGAPRARPREIRGRGWRGG